MKYRLFLLIAAMLGFSHTAQAYQECMFDSSADVSVIGVMAAPTIVPLPVGTVSEITPISSVGVLRTTPTLKSHCVLASMMDNGKDVYQMTNNAMVYSQHNGEALFTTNVPGIYYTITFAPDGLGTSATFPLIENIYQLTGQVSNTSAVDGKTWYARIQFYQNGLYQGVPSDVNELKIGAGPVGHILLGNPSSDHYRPSVYMSETAFDIPLDRPTCALRAPVTVNLGDWYATEITTSGTAWVPFHIVGTCANTSTVEATIVSQNPTADKKYFGNSVEDGATKATTGVAMQLQYFLQYDDDPNTSTSSPINVSPQFKWVTLALGKYNSLTGLRGPVYSFDRLFQARLVKTGSKVTAGGFGTDLIYQVTYQ